MASSFNMPCVGRNFFFLMTGIGKGIFNIFVGTLLFLNENDGMATLMGWAMIGSGLAFIFLSKVKNMSDDDMQRALSIYGEANKAQMEKAANSGARKGTAHFKKTV